MATSQGRRRRIGVLAIQGNFEAHTAMLGRLGAEPIEVRRPAQLESIDGLVIPGGESTTIGMGVEAYGLETTITGFVGSGRPVLGTCAGLILLDDSHLDLMDIHAQRNAYGRQIHSFEAPIQVRGLGDEPFTAIFIRAPRIERWGDDVEVLAELDGDPVVARQGNILVAAFHPELTDDPRVHEMFCSLVDSDMAVAR